MPTLKLVADLAQLNAIRDFVSQALDGLIEPTRIARLVLAVDELVTNTISYGYGEASGPVEIQVENTEEGLHIYLRDRAPIFDPTLHKPPPAESITKRRPGGIGLTLVRFAADEIRHRALPGGGNEVILVARSSNRGGEK